MTEFESRAADWLTVEEALARVLADARPGTVERLPLAEALGRALSSGVSARATLPPWDNSAMDGYAVREDDVRGATLDAPVRLRVVGASRAGGPPLPMRGAADAVSAGTAVRIMTGAPVPPGADTVIRVEDTDREAGEAGTVEVRSARDVGRNVRPGGQDMRRGDLVLEAGTTLGPGQLALAAAAGHHELDVHVRPSVHVLSTGDELRTSDEWESVARGEGIPETNGVMLAAAAAAAGAAPRRPRIARDTPESITAELEAARDADVLVTSGGASMGEADLLKRVLDGLGFELAFWRVKLRPGSPFSFGLLPRAERPALPIFGLPGNPASAFVTFELFVRPFLLRLAGHRRLHRRVVQATAGEPLGSSEGLVHYHRVVFDVTTAHPRIRLTGPQGSGLVRSVGRADGLAVVPAGVPRIAEGDPVDVILLDAGPGAWPVAGSRDDGP